MYSGGDLDLPTPEGAYYGGMETLRAKWESYSAGLIACHSAGKPGSFPYTGNAHSVRPQYKTADTTASGEKSWGNHTVTYSLCY